MRIAIVNWGLSPPFGLGGTSRYVNRLANELGRLGHDVTVFYSHGYTESQLGDSFKAVRIPVSSIPALRLFEFGRRLRQLVSSRFYDVVHVHVPQLAWGLSSDVPIVLTIHTTADGEASGILKGGIHSLLDIARLLLFRTLAKETEQSTIRRASAIVVVNPTYVEELRGIVKSSDTHVCYIEPAVERSSLMRYDRVSARKALGVAESDFLVLFVGRLDARKNPLVLVDGVALAIQNGIKNIRLVYCGDGSLRSDLERKIDALSLSENARVMGRVSEETLSQAYSASDVYVLPSEIEGFPATLLECRFFGLPSIVGPFPGVDRVVSDGFTGIVLKKIGAEAISAALISLANSPHRLAVMSKHSSDVSAKSNAWDVVASQMITVYRIASDVHSRKRRKDI